MNKGEAKRYAQRLSRYGHSTLTNSEQIEGRAEGQSNVPIATNGARKMSYEFKTVPVPVVTRSREPNPFTETVGKMNVGGDAISFVAPTVDEKEVAAIVRQLRAAGRETNVTIRVITREGKIGNKTATQVTFWAVPKQTRPRKDSTA